MYPPYGLGRSIVTHTHNSSVYARRCISTVSTIWKSQRRPCAAISPDKKGYRGLSLGALPFASVGASLHAYIIAAAASRELRHEADRAHFRGRGADSRVVGACSTSPLTLPNSATRDIMVASWASKHNHHNSSQCFTMARDGLRCVVTSHGKTCRLGRYSVAVVKSARAPLPAARGI